MREDELSVKQVGRSEGNYNYEIYRGTELVARYWHDFRGDEQGLTMIGGKRASPPGSCSEFIAGGGGNPLTLTEAAVELIRRHL